jgi:hypothetical protein
VVEEDVHMAPQRLRWAPQKWWGHGCTTPPCLHWYITVVTWRRNFSKWWHIILLCTSFLGHRRSYFSSPTQEVLPLTNLLSPQEKVLIFYPIGAIYFGHFEASPLIFTYIFAFFIFSNRGEVPVKR